MSNVRFTKILFCLILIGLAPAANAHQVGISRGNYNVVEDTVKAELIFARLELEAALPQLEGNQELLTEQEISAASLRIKRMIVDHVTVTTDSKLCSGDLQEVTLTEGDGLMIRAIYRCPNAPETLKLNLNFLHSLSRGHRHLATVTAGDLRIQTLAFESNSEVQLAGGSVKASTAKVLAFFRLGIEHILTGYDHLLFLFGLILIGGSIRQLMIVVSSFTLGHSITLGLSALGIWAPGPTFVEPAIALSIAYVGAENWFIKNASRRWLITFPFGLIHGFGFAGALGQISLPQDQIPQALAGFNFGVEAGQLTFLILVMPLVLWMRHRQWFADRGVKGLSTGIVIAGVWLFVTRIG